MNQQPTVFDRLLAMTAEVERILAHSVVSDEIRDACAIVRGHLDLVRLYGEPVNIDDLERGLARVISEIGDAKFRRRFLTQLRMLMGWARFAPAPCDPEPTVAPEPA